MAAQAIESKARQQEQAREGQGGREDRGHDRGQFAVGPAQAAETESQIARGQHGQRQAQRVVTPRPPQGHGQRRQGEPVGDAAMAEVEVRCRGQQKGEQNERKKIVNGQLSMANGQ